ncbi:membrane protein [Intrasporangium chromatireducens Q5-1]|uniref:Membrane protein n=1 Tax=Intrasporangium chromatireducens Q5-1 TaxID=584657 RepID=W9GPQ4_9MICO|nr:hypothetical protein [Intrasporangium chromatireducens]EWT05879.1 membrane protein [Intrasporangium chromatireducens Q5-1]
MTETLTWVFAVLFVLVVVAWYLTYTAARLDRLHVRLTGTVAALDAQLVRRAEASVELANSGLLDGATALILAGAAAQSLETPDEDGEIREAVESDLTEALSLALTSEVVDDLRQSGPLGVDHLERLSSACTRVQLARRFHNDAVTDVRRVRRKLVVRLFHLAGHTPMPGTVEFNDEVPPGLEP